MKRNDRVVSVFFRSFFSLSLAPLTRFGLLVHSIAETLPHGRSARQSAWQKRGLLAYIIALPIFTAAKQGRCDLGQAKKEGNNNENE